MKKSLLKMVLAAAAVAALGAADAASFYKTVDGLCVGPVKISCGDAGAWTFATTRGVGADGVDELEIAIDAPSPQTPPMFCITFDFPAVDAHHRWTGAEDPKMPPSWHSFVRSRLCEGLPVIAFVNDDDRNRATVSWSEAKRVVNAYSSYRQTGSRLDWSLNFFEEKEAPLKSYRVKIRFDRRDVFFGDAIASASKWVSETAGLKPAKVPDAAFEPLYSSWYSFRYDVTDQAIEAECAEAAKLGMKAVIVDDGWQADVSRGYATCGDWQVSKKRFPDFAAHVKRVQEMGLKYMIWYSVPFVGLQSANHARFQGKYLCDKLGASVLDPRFPEVRQFLCETYAKAMKEWNLDGLKLDFIDSFAFIGEDPAVKENYAGRDVKSLAEAVDVLMKEVYAAITAVRPDALIEFRQRYVGPGIRQYGNMFRASDCPGDLLLNRVRIANLRLASGETAVHADMLEWHFDETAESAARFVLSSIFGVIQYSVMLRDAPADHKRMIAHWIKFSRDHRETLLKGAFRPRHYGAGYPVIEAESAAERIVAVYDNLCVADCGAADKPVYVLNATGKAKMTIKLAAPCAKAEVYDTFGALVSTPSLASGVQELVVPESGHVKIY